MDYAPATDRKSVNLVPGDKVRFKLYPKGTAEGIVVVSPRSEQRLPDGTWAPSLVIQTEGGTLYSIHTKGVLKLSGSV